MIKKICFITCFIFILSSLSAQHLKREMRAVWIATVANIDWPSQRNLTSKAQRDEMRLLLDQFAKNNINAIVLQIRPTADARRLNPGQIGLQVNKDPDPILITILFNL